MDVQSRILEYIKSYKRKNDGNSPTIRMIARACHISSTSMVVYHLRELEKNNEIVLPGGVRNIHVNGGQWSYRPEQLR